MNVPTLPLHDQVLLAHSLLSQNTAKLLELARGPLRPLGAFLFLHEADTESFLRETAPRLATLLRRRTKRVTSTNEGRVRGRVDWAATQKAQAVTAGQYVCRESRLDYDQPENQCFLLTLKRLKNCLRWIEITEESHSGPTQDRTEEYLLRLRGQWERVGRLLPSGHITTPRYVTPEQRRAIERAKAKEYRVLLTLAQKYDDLILTPRRDAWEAGMRHTCPIPARLRDYVR